MNYYTIGSKFNKQKRGNSGKRAKPQVNMITLVLISLLLISIPITLFSKTVCAAEPSLESILNDLGFSNIEATEVETFSAGTYIATFLAEFGDYHYINTLSYYEIETSNYQTIFSGPEGANGDGGGFITPPISKMFVAENQFGLSMLATQRYYSEHFRNPDYPEQHTQIYVNLDSPTMLLIAFEDFTGGFDRDYNDMVFSLEQVFPPEIVSVVRYPEKPNYNQSVMVTAQVTKGNNEIESVILSYQADSYSWVNVTMSLGSSGYRADIPAMPYNRQINYKIYATDTKGYSDVSTLASYTTIIPGRSPIATFQCSPSIVKTGEIIDFNASASHDPDGTIVSYTWDFGDGTTDSKVNTSHSYLENGIYTVTLEIIDNEDLIDNSVQAIKVNNRAPVAALTEAPTIINQAEVTLDASPSNDVDGSIVSYIWSFGDGTAATGITTTHRYDNTGVYNITLTVIDDDGATDSYVHSLQVNDLGNNPPVTSPKVNKETAGINETISFDGTESYDPDGTIISYSWDFGDGTSSSEASVDHRYNAGGTYTVKLTTVDDAGAIDEATILVTVTETVVNIPPIAIFTESATEAKEGESIFFDASASHDPDGTIVSYTWDFGDASTGSGITIEHAYSQSGKYTITLTVTDNSDDSSSVVTEINVETESNISLVVLSGIGLGLTALIAALIYIYFKRKNKNKKS